MSEEILIRGGAVIDGSGRPGETADIMVRNGRIAAIGRVAAGGVGPGHRRRGPGGGAGVYRHQDAFGFHPADQPQGREQGAPGGDDRDYRPLRVFGRAGVAGQARADPRLPLRQRTLAAVPRDRFSGIPRHFPQGRGQCRHAGRPPHLAAQRHGHGGPAADRRPSSKKCRRCSTRGWRRARSASRPGSSRRPAAMPNAPRSWRCAMSSNATTRSTSRISATNRTRSSQRSRRRSTSPVAAASMSRSCI